MTIRAFLDAVEEASTGRIAVAVVHTHAESHAAFASEAIPDPQFANPQAIEQTIRLLEKEFSTGSLRAWLALLEHPEEILHDRCVDVLEWSLWGNVVRRESLGSICIPQRIGLRGAKTQHEFRSLPDSSDLKQVVVRVSRTAATFGFAQEADSPVISVVPYGIPRTPAALALARFLSAAGLQEDVQSLKRRFAWVRISPSSFETQQLRSLEFFMGEELPRPTAVARIKVHFARSTDDVAAIGVPVAYQALTRMADDSRPKDRQKVAQMTLRVLIGEISGIAQARTGDYEACEEVLRLFVDREDEKVPSILEEVFAGDHWTLAQAYAQRARIANHRGDFVRAYHCLDLVFQEAQHERSLRMFLLMVESAVLQAVAAQNRWPFPPENPGDAVAMQGAAEHLVQVIERFNELRVCIEPASGGGEDADLDSSGKARDSDPMLGMALGTLGRTYAFLGRHDHAIRCLLEARRHFSSPGEREVNAIFVAQVELDRAGRLDVNFFEKVFSAIIDPDGRSAEEARQRLARGDARFRFTMNVILKVLVRGTAVSGVNKKSWAEQLSRFDENSLFMLISRSRSHPSELVARHAGEFLLRTDNKEAAERWLRLGVEIAREGGETLQRLAVFTERLLNGEGPALEQPRGSILNPCYEYR